MHCFVLFSTILHTSLKIMYFTDISYLMIVGHAGSESGLNKCAVPSDRSTKPRAFIAATFSWAVSRW
jgi:hypothetical protein